MAQQAGVYSFPIAGRVASERERTLGVMTPAERAWRKQWLKDQILDANEPCDIEMYWKERTNPIRRIYQMGPQSIVRFLAGKLLMAGFGVLCIHYYFKYNGNDWTKKGGWRILRTRPMVLPCQPEFPFKPDRCEHSDYANRNFRNSPI